MKEVDQSSLLPLIKHPKNEHVAPGWDRTWAPNHDKDGKRILYQRTSEPDINLTIRNV